MTPCCYCVSPPRLAGVLLSLMLVLAGPAAAQQGVAARAPVIRGVVVDDQTRAPVVAAAVELLRPDSSVLAAVTTDAEGRFRLAPPSAGVYRVRASRLGYGTGESAEVNLAATDSVFVELRISPTPLILDSLLVRGRADARPLRATEQLIHGRILDDDTREPVRGGAVQLLRADGSTAATTISNEQGLFRVVTPAPGPYTLRVERLGYRTADGSRLHMMLGDTIRLDFFLSTRAILLDPILVTGSARPWSDRYHLLGMEEFFQRLARFGKISDFVTRERLDWYDRTGRTTKRAIEDAALRRPHGCSGGVDLWLNGGPLMLPQMSEERLFEFLSDAYPPAALEAVEVHTAQPVPAGLMLTPFACRVIVLWTRRQPKR